MRLFGNPKPKEKKPEATPAPTFDPSQFVSRDSINDLVKQAVTEATAQDKQTIAELRGTVETLRTQPAGQPAAPAPAPAAQLPDISDDEIDTIIASGEKGGAAKIRALVKRQVEGALTGVSKQVDELRQFGLTTMASMAKKAALDEMPHYKRFQKEIDDAVSKLDPAYQARPDTFKYIHDQIVGANFTTLETERAEAAARAAEEAVAATAPGSGKGTASDTPKLPTAEELGRDQRLALESAGKDVEQFAKSLGYESWSDYMERAAESGLDLSDVAGTA